MRVLLIEDDRALARSIELMLKAAGFNVYMTDLGEDGVDLGKVYEYDMILLDLSLPDISGFEVLKQLRMSRVNTPVMILSGNPDIEAKVKTLECQDVSKGHRAAPCFRFGTRPQTAAGKLNGQSVDLSPLSVRFPLRKAGSTPVSPPPAT